MEFDIGEAYVVTPIRFEKFGAIVELEDGTTSLVHISEISESFVSDPANYLDIGKQYVAKAVRGDSKHPIQLSVRHLGLQSQVDLKAATSVSENNNHKRTRKNPYPLTSKHMHRQVNTHADLDSMIESADLAYRDKMKSRAKRDKKKRR